MASIHPQRNTRGTSWRVMWRTEDGVQRSRTFPSRPEARRFKTTVEGLEQAGRAPDPTRGEITLEDWAGLVLAGLHLKPKSAETYASLLRSRILPTFGYRQLQTIQRHEVRGWVAEMALEVSPRRTRNAHALLSRLLHEAVLDGRLLTNPAEGIPLPRQAPSEVRPWTVEELLTVAGEAGRYGGLIVFLGFMGTRWAEAVGLTWDKVRDRRVVIDSSLSEVNGRFHRVSTKTFEIRQLPLPDEVASRLPERGSGLVFATSYGNPIRSAAFRSRIFLPACARAGVRPIRIHHLRHTSASLLLQQGAGMKVVQEWLGHRDVRITMNTYAHLYSKDMHSAAALLDSATSSALATLRGPSAKFRNAPER
jgi:integrase